MDDDSIRKSWDDDPEDRFYSSDSHSDDSPRMLYRLPGTIYPRTKIKNYDPSNFRFNRICIFCTAILFFALMYIPVYHKVYYHIPKGIVAGWSIHTNRDTKLYVQPNNVTTIYEPKDVCNKKNKLTLLIIVCSATDNIETRNAIRETWGSYKNYKKDLKIFNEIRSKYKNYNYSYDLYPNFSDLIVDHLQNDNTTYNIEIVSTSHNRTKRDVSINDLLPAFAKMLNNVTLSKTDNVEKVEKRFEDDDDPLIPEFDMNKEIGGRTEPDAEIIDYDNDYQSNIMRIPPKGDEEDIPNPDLNKIVNLLKQSKDFEKFKELSESDNPEFKVVFLLGLPAKENSTMQKKIDEEYNKYGDIIQEGFIDSYNNLTLKSIMMLKWVTNKCNDSVRYILKLDDDVYVNVPNLMLNLKNRSEVFDKRTSMGDNVGPEYLLIGVVISGARPVLNAHNKWYSPRYMYGGRVYPRYLSGAGYAMSLPAARALYAAALTTRYFHLEDVYITGMCSIRAQPRVYPRDDRQFSYVSVRKSDMPCWAHSLATMHRVQPGDMRSTRRVLLDLQVRDRCERKRLTQIRRDRLRQKMKPKKTLAHVLKTHK